MTIERLKSQLDMQPFQPFVIHVADGREVSIPHPDFVALGPLGRTFIVYRPDESYHIVDLLLVTDLHVMPPSSRNGGEATPLNP